MRCNEFSDKGQWLRVRCRSLLQALQRLRPGSETDMPTIAPHTQLLDRAIVEVIENPPFAAFHVPLSLCAEQPCCYPPYLDMRQPVVQ